MDFDFNLILVPLTIGLGIVWLLDKLVLKHRKTRGRGQEGILVRWAYDFFPVLAVVLVVRSFLIEPFNIPKSVDVRDIQHLGGECFAPHLHFACQSEVLQVQETFAH